MKVPQSIVDFVQQFIPVSRRTVLDLRGMPGSIASTLDVDRVHGILEASVSGDTEGLFTLYSDIIAHGSHLQGRLNDRKEAVLSDTLSIQPVGGMKALPEDKLAADAVRAMLADFPADVWEKAVAHLLSSFLWPVGPVEKTFRPSTQAGLRYELADLTPVPHVLLTWINGKRELRALDPATGYPTGQTFVPEPERYIMHVGNLLTEVPENWGGPMRCLVFWWLLATQSKDWWARFLDKYGTPFLVGKFDKGDDASRSILARAFAYCTKLGGLVVSKETDVEIKQAAASDSGEAYKVFIEVCNREMSKLVLGETLSSDAQSSGGMNSGGADAHNKKREEKRRGDARRLGATLREQLFKQFLQINGFTGRAPLAVWGSVSSEEMEALASVLDTLSGAGLEVADDALPIISDRFGLPVQRKAGPPAGGLPGVVPFAASVPALKKKADASVDLIAEAGGVDLARVFPGELAPIRGILMASSTPEEAMRDVLAFCAKFEPGKSARVMEDALLAMAANGAVANLRQ